MTAQRPGRNRDVPLQPRQGAPSRGADFGGHRPGHYGTRQQRGGEAIYFMHYNFVRIHQTLKVTPVMAAGVTSKLWEVSDLVAILEAWEAKQA